MVRRSAALLVVRDDPEAGPLLLIGHMGGPFWARKDAGAWSIPKGEYLDDEEPEAAARRELTEETGYVWPPDRPVVDLGEFRQTGGKRVKAFLAVEHALVDEGEHRWELADFRSNTFPLEWPPRSGRFVDVPEIDRVGWVSTQVAREKLVKGQLAVVDAAASRVGETRRPDEARYSG